MTAEVAVANKLAVALAADSAVTVGRGSHQKTYDTVNKLFTLSKFHPVGIMVYGNSEFMGFPWESVIKSYRAQLKNRSFPTIEDYSEDFFRYLSNDLCKYTSENINSNAFLIVFDRLVKLWTGNNLRKATDDEIDRLEKMETICEVGKEYVPIIKEAIHIVFDDEAEVEDIDNKFSLLRKLFRVSILSLQKADFSSYMSGVVIAGFGEKEMFPTIINYHLDGMLGDSLKRKTANKHDADRRSGAFVKGFAQDDMVFRFMEGVDRGYQQHVLGTVVGFVFRQMNKLLDDLFSGTEEEKNQKQTNMTEELAKQFKELVKDLSEYREEQFVKPIVGTLDSLPKDELANLAEALVSLTSLKRKVSEDMETVGGPIDVAIISKGDGFIWTKRKHYFDPSLNTAFVQNYLQS